MSRIILNIEFSPRNFLEPTAIGFMQCLYLYSPNDGAINFSFKWLHRNSEYSCWLKSWFYKDALISECIQNRNIGFDIDIAVQYFNVRSMNKYFYNFLNNVPDFTVKLSRIFCKYIRFETSTSHAIRGIRFEYDCLKKCFQRKLSLIIKIIIK